MPLGPEQRIVFVMGKGGVGKTSVAAALCRIEADRHGSAMLVEFEGNPGAARALGSEGEGIRQVVVGYAESLVELVASLTDSRLLGQLIVGQRALKRVLRAVPAVRELAALERVRQLSRRETRLVVDLPATGHGIDWLRVPAAAERFLRVGPLSDLCARLREQVLAPALSAVVVVSSVEPVVAAETRELCRRLWEEVGYRPSLLVANRVPRRPDTQNLELLARLGRSSSSWRALEELVLDDIERARTADEALAMLRSVAGAPLAIIPELFADPAPSHLARYLGTHE
jgi:arsenite/tail-anchored protein-transporting ATPase